MWSNDKSLFLILSALALRANGQSCPEVYIFGARETTASAGFGSAGAMIDMIIADHPNATSEAIVYPACGGQSSCGSISYADSAKAGTSAVATVVNDFNTECPDTQIVLVGYSQGGQIMDNALCGGGDSGAGITDTTVPISTSALKMIKATILMGDPRYVSGLAYGVGTCTSGGFDARASGFVCPSASKVQLYCDAEDPYCCNGSDAAHHQQYVSLYGDEALAFVNSKLATSTDSSDDATTVATTVADDTTETSAVATAAGASIPLRHLRAWSRRLPQIAITRRTYADIIVKVPQMAESISEGTLEQFSKRLGQFVEQDEEIATVETDKIDVAVNAPEAGTIREFLVSEKDTVIVGQGLVRLELGDTPPSIDNEVPQESRPENEKSYPITEDPEPIRNIKEQPDLAVPPPVVVMHTEPESISTSSIASADGPNPGHREEYRLKMNRMRLRIAERLKQSQNSAAPLTTFNEVDMSSIIELWKLHKNDVLERTGTKLGFMGAITRACVLALRDLPIVNASIEGPNGGDTIVYRNYIDIGITVASANGLATPVLRNVETMDMVGIEKSIADMGQKGRNGKLTIEDMTGGTFTIDESGVFGSLMGTTMINLPQTAVLGVHSIRERPIAVNGKVQVRPMMYLSLTYDHRLLDGREGTGFLVKVKEYMEDPRRLLL
ncbi:hypothetical protein G7Z17_g444 [Cylindrodendrum hubeiense]|uniref:dihydrolipoyllysine-residue succinyltransferase n=1 Tax=Cylindrodendrum hubeiense TaxID=595255 RepID=A0A9P5LDB5_9HYPO|nr:hypothetical protein G7Z17_g444 [Cylindrodendrum hubeiense]